MKKVISIEKIMELSMQNNESIKESDGEMLEILDENGEILGIAPRFLCHRLGLMHQVVYLIIEDFDGRLLVQTRGDMNKKRYDLPVGGHMNVNDCTPVDALWRETKEEIGLEINKKDLTMICKYPRKVLNDLKKPKEINYELRYVFIYKVDNEQKKSIFKKFNERIEKKVVLDINWFSIEDILKNSDLSNVADGLYATMPHYLMWKLNNR